MLTLIQKLKWLLDAYIQVMTAWPHLGNFKLKLIVTIKANVIIMKKNSDTISPATYEF